MKVEAMLHIKEHKSNPAQHSEALKATLGASKQSMACPPSLVFGHDEVSCVSDVLRQRFHT